MKKISLFLGVLCLMLLQNSPLMAQPAKAVAKMLLNRTNVVVNEARKMVKLNKNYTGDLGKAVKHQKYARQMYLDGKYQQAANHSQRARLLAIDAVKANKGKVEKDWILNKKEKALVKTSPSASELDATAKVGNESDQSVVEEKIDDVND